MKSKKRIAILGGGPSALFMFKRLIRLSDRDISIDIFERKDKIGPGMPYSADGANDEHITNISSNEIPLLVTSLADWINTVPKDTLYKFHIDPERFNEYKVLPRLLFGQYLQAQFGLLQKQAKAADIAFNVHYNSPVTDVTDDAENRVTVVEVNHDTRFEFDHVIICTGHSWPVCYEGKVPRYFDSPYPPSKLALKLNHAVAITGSSLTAIDAVRTLAKYNGIFEKDNNGKLIYHLDKNSPNFKLILHTRNGMLPAVRFHLADPHLFNRQLMTEQELTEHIKANNGFLALDYIFERDFKLPIRAKEPDFYEKIKDMRLEEFVNAMMALRKRLNPFQLLAAEYAEAERSIKRRESIYWKEMLGVLSFALNYPAKHLSAEDMLRLQTTLMPLISIVIAYIPQSSADELLALHDAGIANLITVRNDSRVEPVETGGAVYHYTDEDGEGHAAFFNTYVNCTGQPHLSFNHFPFAGLIAGKTISPARLKFRSDNEGAKALAEGKDVVLDPDGSYYLTVPGMAINDHFQVIDAYGAYSDRIYMMAVPYIGGYNPDYSGLDFGQAASEIIVKRMFDL